jgi:hypothetical protein
MQVWLARDLALLSTVFFHILAMLNSDLLFVFNLTIDRFQCGFLYLIIRRKGDAWQEVDSSGSRHVIGRKNFPASDRP